MAKKTLTQRIAFTGGKEMVAELKKIGDAGRTHLNDLKTSAAAADASFKALQNQLKETGARFQQLGDRMKTVGRNMSLYITTPLAGIATVGVASFTKFEKSIANIATVIDRSSESVDGIKNGILALGKEVPVALDDLAEGMYQVRSAGISAADAFRVLGDAARLGVAGRGTTTEAVNLLTSAINAFGLKGKEATHAANVLFTAVKNGKTTISELQQGFGNVAPIIEASGVSFNEFVAAATAMTGPGKKASESFTAIRAALVALKTQTADAKKLFKELGVDSFGELVKRSGGMVAAFNKLRDAAHGDETALTKAVGGGEALAAVLSLTGKQAEKFTDTLKEMSSGVDNLGPAFKVQLKTLDSQFTLLKNSLTELSISIGASLAPVIEAVIPIIRKLTDFLEGVPGPIKAIGIAFAALLAATGPVVWIAGHLVTSWGRLLVMFGRFPVLLRTAITVIVGTRNALAGLRVAILAARAATGPYGVLLQLLVVGLTALAGYLIASGVNFDDWKEKVTTTVTTVTEVWSAFEEYLSQKWHSISQGFNDALKAMSDYVKGFYDSAKEFFGGIISWAERAIEALRRYASTDRAAGGGASKGMRGGGAVIGPGSGTSDSIPAMLSNGEFVHKAAAVRYYGQSFMDAINRMAIPRGALDGLRSFANGGLVHSLRPLMAVPGYANGGLVDSVNTGAGMRPITLQIGDHLIPGMAADGRAVDRIQRLAVQKAQQSGGVKPSWYYHQR